MRQKNDDVGAPVRKAEPSRSPLQSSVEDSGRISASIGSALPHEAPAVRVGQRVWLVYQHYGRSREQAITEQVVATVGRKYFTLVGDSDKYSLETMREQTGYTPRYTVITDLQAYYDEREREKLWSALKSAFSPFRPTLTLDTLRAMHGLLDPRVSDRSGATEGSGPTKEDGTHGERGGR